MANTGKLRCKYCRDSFPRLDMVKYPAGRFCTKEHAAVWALENKQIGQNKIDKAERKKTRTSQEKQVNN